MKAIIVDDERLAIESFKMVIQQVEDVELVGSYTNPADALKALETIKVDVIFLDIEMGDIHGIDLARKLKEKKQQTPIIFVTAHPQFAVDAFEVKAFDYLLKPVQKERLQETIHYLQESIGKTKEPQEAFIKDTLTVGAFGNFQLYKNGREEVKWRTKKVKELFAYLWHHFPQSVPRDRIIEDVWGDQHSESAVQLMHTSFYHLRKTIRDLGFENPVTFSNDQYSLTLDIQSDQFEIDGMMQKQSLTDEEIDQLLKLYKGNYFEGENYDWALPKQEQIKVTFLATLEKFVTEKLKANDLSVLVEICLEKMTAIDPYNERFVYLLIDYYGRMKNIAKIIKIAEHFEEMWTQEIGLPIPEEISSIYYHYITKRSK